VSEKARLLYFQKDPPFFLDKKNVTYIYKSCSYMLFAALLRKLEQKVKIRCGTHAKSKNTAAADLTEPGPKVIVMWCYSGVCHLNE
jgi:hypothetical protein